MQVGHSVLFRSVRYILLRSKKRMLRSFPFFLKFLATYQTPKERYVLFRSFLKNGKPKPVKSCDAKVCCATTELLYLCSMGAQA